jgi:vesicle-associated membrane protein 4
MDEAAEAMYHNIQYAGDRGKRLDRLQNQTDYLATAAQGFRTGATRVGKKFRWKDMKMRICLVVVIIVILVVVIVPAGKFYFRSYSNTAETSPVLMSRQ